MDARSGDETFQSLTRHFQDKARDAAFDDHQYALAVKNGVHDLDQVSRMLNQALVTGTATSSVERQRAQRAMRDQLFQAALQELYRQRDEYEARIEAHQAYFNTQLGEDWRESLAQHWLSGDDFPQRRAGEPMDDYRARLEDALLAEIIGADGLLKPEYRDHPEAERLQQWADDRRALRDVEGHIAALEIADTPEAQIRALQAALQDSNVQAMNQLSAQTLDGVQADHSARATDTVFDQSDDFQAAPIDAQTAAGSFFHNP